VKKKILAALIVAGFATVPFAAQAEGEIGTWAKSFADGVPNIYYQGKISDKSAWLVDVGSGDVLGITITAVSGLYKGYFTDYSNGAYWFLGGSFASGGGISATAGLGGVGYEVTLGQSFVLGGLVGVAFGSGGSANVYDVTIGYKL